jgi:hypothetical protein
MRCERRSEVANSGQEFVDALGGMIRQAGQRVGKPGLGINVVELGGGDESVDRSRTPAALIGAGERPISSLFLESLALDIDALDRLGPDRRLAEPARSKNLRRPCAQHAASTIGPGLRLAS